MGLQGYRFTVREFVLAYLYGMGSVDREQLLGAFRLLYGRGLILLGGPGRLERELREMIALGVVEAEDGLLRLPPRLRERERRLLGEKWRLLSRALHQLTAEGAGEGVVEAAAYR